MGHITYNKNAHQGVAWLKRVPVRLLETFFIIKIRVIRYGLYILTERQKYTLSSYIYFHYRRSIRN